MKNKLITYPLIIILPALIAAYIIYHNLIGDSLIADSQQTTVIQNKPAGTRSQPANDQKRPPIIQDLAISTLNQPSTSDSSLPKTQKNILLDVPFTSQAPFGNWRDPKEQNGCEEASALMAVYWARQKKLTPAIALKEIIASSDYEQKKYYNYYDTSAPDTVKRIFNGYFNFKNAILKSPKSADEIINELKNGKVVIVPVNGQKVGNPYYTRPGPLEHNLVIKGFDFTANEFIVNDAGTRRGNGYRYKKDILWQALRDYPTGQREPIKKIIKDMIVVSPE